MSVPIQWHRSQYGEHQVSGHYAYGLEYSWDTVQHELCRLHLLKEYYSEVGGWIFLGISCGVTPEEMKNPELMNRQAHLVLDSLNGLGKKTVSGANPSVLCFVPDDWNNPKLIFLMYA